MKKGEHNKPVPSDLQKRAEEILSRLERVYPDAPCFLTHRADYQLLIAVRLSAQCTDARVNMVTRQLFVEFPTLESFANAELARLQEAIRSCGFYVIKSRDIKQMACALLERHGGVVPHSMEDLLALPGVGRKTANLIRGDLFGLPAIVTDTHCIRIAYRTGLAETKKPEQVERALVALIPPERSNDFCHRLVQFGRDVCKARKPHCADCPLLDVCERRTQSDAASCDTL